MKTILLLAFGLLMVCWPGAAADVSATRIERALKDLDETVPQKKIKAIHKELAELLKLDLAILEKAIGTNKWLVGDLVVAHYIAIRSSEPLSSVLVTNNKGKWTKQLVEKKIPFAEAFEYLDETQAKIALIMIEHRFGKD